ncbi:MAG: 30S ribosome-binding factor RbfA [Anaerolineales bacterium]|nr:30S ribosome-binding factor RbfA [Chloroflexota bacterium]MBL6980781.1 30S ribosome-binding factor RbfA [Anaerolineales bacterium]
MVTKVRAQRIADRIHEELSGILLMEVSDPRVVSAYITKVRVDNELSYANIYVSSMEGSEEADSILEGLNHASGYLRRELAQRVELRHFPKLRFYWDPSPEHADRIDQLLASLDTGEEDPEDQDSSEEK